MRLEDRAVRLVLVGEGGLNKGDDFGGQRAAKERSTPIQYLFQLVIHIH